MGQITAQKPLDFTNSQIATIRRSVAAEANDLEFDTFINMAREYGLNPFKKQLHLIVYNKNDPQKRKVAIFPSRDGFRALAARQGDYRPASEKAQFETDESLKGSPENPAGLISCTTYLHKMDRNGQWNPVEGTAYWEEFAPISEQWEWYDKPDGKRGRRPTGKKAVNDTWAKMPRVMLQKCAEGQALRAGWPDAFSGLYDEAEFDQMQRHDRHMKDITPSDAVHQQEVHERQSRLGDPALLMVMDDSAVLQRVRLGDVADRAAEFIKENDPEAVYVWTERNKESLREFWAYSKNDALELNRLIEKKLAGTEFSKEKERTG